HSGRSRNPARQEISIDHNKAAVWPSDDTNQTPRRHSFCTSSLVRRFTRLVVDLPRQRSAPFPTHALRPNENGLSLAIACDSRVLAATSVAGRGDEIALLACFRVYRCEIDLIFRFPGGEHAGLGLGERGGT